MIKKILAIGAFERDNFGDLLFLRILREFLEGRGVEIIPASIMFSDMREVNGEVVYPYKTMLSAYKWDAVWVVGGEVGGVDISSAVLMDAIDEYGKAYLRLADTERKLYNQLLNIPDSLDSPAYLPDLTKYSDNRKTIMVVNSVGFSNSVLNKRVSKREVEILSRSKVSVREGRSANFCEGHEIQYTLAPDVVSTISLFFPFEKQSKDPYIVAQINNELLSTADIPRLSLNLKEIGNQFKAKIILLRAGVTFGHDDITLYEKIFSQIKATKPKYGVEQFDKRDPLRIAELIAGSKLCIATSLHCRVVSESYGVPRISLFNNKVTNYLSTWKEKDPYPYNVDIDNLKEATIQIKDIIEHPIETDNSLGIEALNNLNVLYKHIIERVHENKTSNTENDIFVEYAKEQKPLLDRMFEQMVTERDSNKREIMSLVYKARDLELRLEDYENTLSKIVESRSYRIGQYLTAPYRCINKYLRGHDGDK